MKKLYAYELAPAAAGIYAAQEAAQLLLALDGQELEIMEGRELLEQLGAAGPMEDYDYFTLADHLDREVKVKMEGVEYTPEWFEGGVYLTRVPDSLARLPEEATPINDEAEAATLLADAGWIGEEPPEKLFAVKRNGETVALYAEDEGQFWTIAD